MYSRILRFLVCVVCALSCTFGATVRPLQGGSAEINVSGASNNIVHIEAANDLSQGNWEVISSVLLQTNALKWLDTWTAGASNRFYRIRQANATGVEHPHAENFRLIDHAGKSHELHYFWNDDRVKAFVLIFAANGCGELTNQVAAIRALKQKFEPLGVKFWMINSKLGEERNGRPSWYQSDLSPREPCAPEMFSIVALHRRVHAVGRSSVSRFVHRRAAVSLAAALSR